MIAKQMYKNELCRFFYYKGLLGSSYCGFAVV